ncbi:MAG TPA: hypothetical protein VMY05_01670 [Acidobacteriota bacterium]|nr:hypothetical protein [Acidobacteriota bacterium]
MKDRVLDLGVLVVVQRVMWYLFLVWFLTTTLLSVLGWPISADLSRWGIIIVLLATLTRLIVLSEMFRRSAFYRYWLLCFMLAALLLSTIVLAG